MKICIIEKAGREGLTAKKVSVVRNGKEFQQTVYVKGDKNESIVDGINSNMKKELKGISLGAPSTKPVSGPLNDASISAIRYNAMATLSQYTGYLAGQTTDLAHAYIHETCSMLQKRAGELNGIQARHVDDMVRNAVNSLVYQEVISNRHQFTDHGIRHVVKNIQMQNKFLDVLESEGATVTAKDRLLANFTMVRHDMGYTAPEVQKPGMEGIKASGKHKEFSAEYVASQKGRWNEGKIFTPEEYKRGLDIIATHDSTEFDPTDHVKNTARLADNLALFQEAKLPSMFKYVKGSQYYLVKMGEAAKVKDEKAFEENRAELHRLIDRTDSFSGKMKRDLKAGVADINYVTPKYALGTLAGEIKSVSSSDKAAISVTIKHNEIDKVLQTMFDMGQRQAKKFLEDYGVKDFMKNEYTIGKFGNKAMLHIKVIS